MDIIISGTEAVLKNPYIDKDNIGIQGQSWGGYQVAYLVTQTNMFKAAMAGAPVSNQVYDEALDVSQSMDQSSKFFVV